MYHSLKKYLTLNDDVLVYPAHGAGSLCGKGLSEANSSTMGAEKVGNWSLQPSSEEDFIKKLISDQPFIPHYFGFDVDTNRNGADDFEPSINKVKTLPSITNENEAKQLNPDIIIVDTRNESTFKSGHIRGSINIQDGNSFETWLGSIIKPGEKFYLATENKKQLTDLLQRTAKIGYEKFIEAAFVLNYGNALSSKTPLDDFKEHPENYTIIDVRSESEAREKKFGNVTNIPLHELRERIEEIPTNKPVLIHCAGGYRSAAASSIVEANLDEDVKVYDLSEAVKNFN
jgi:hydroxyacylglutathione hydrolase